MTTAEFLRLGDLSAEDDQTLRVKLEALSEYIKDKGRPGSLLNKLCELAATQLDVDITVTDEDEDDGIEDVRDDD